MKQIYIKFSILLFLVFMGLSSAKAQVDQAVSNYAYGSTLGLKLEWTNDVFGSDAANGVSVEFMKMGTYLIPCIKNGAKILITSINVSGQELVETPIVAGDWDYVDLGVDYDCIDILYSYTPVTLNLTSAGYATFCAPFDVTLPEGVIAYKVTGSTANENEGEYSLILESVSGDLPAGTPVILSGDVVSQTYVGVATVTEDQNNTGNYLTGVYANDVKAPAGSYGLQVQNGTTSFYKASKEFNASKYRAYLTLPSESDAKMLTFDETTVPSSIFSASIEAQVSSIFSASGAKLSSMQKGLNIVKMTDGSIKKVLIK